MNKVDVIIIGAGASGMICAAEAGKRGKQVLLLDHTGEMGRKVKISGGGRCNFSNLNISSDNYLSQNPHFCKSALKRFSVYDFLDFLAKNDLSWEERDHGQLFCQDSSLSLLKILMSECRKAGVYVETKKTIIKISKTENFVVQTKNEQFVADSLVIATGGLAWPQLGATGFGHDIAIQFGLKVLPCRPGLVPLTIARKIMQKLSTLSGIALETVVEHAGKSFREALLFTHHGLSGPAILQISNYWQPGKKISVNFLPDYDLPELISQWQQESPGKLLSVLLGNFIAKRIARTFLETYLIDKPVNQYNSREAASVSELFHNWRPLPTGTSGWEKAEVTLGGVDTNELSSKTFESNKVKGLYFIGEVLDITGQLGGYNLHWAWASGFCAGQLVK